CARQGTGGALDYW
nr:immunoglobulin heavy chain junction region [Mus musculus]MBK4198560.1 immunoglobulin heavy chain junction region [Mus musculus]